MISSSKAISPETNMPIIASRSRRFCLYCTANSTVLFYTHTLTLRQACVENITSKWDLIGPRFRNEFPILPWEVVKYVWKTCKSLLQNTTLLAALRKPGGDPHRRWDVAVLDGTHPECLLAILHDESVPIILLNTVISLASHKR